MDHGENRQEMDPDLLRRFREQALLMIEDGLEAAQAQHPLDLMSISQPERPTLGNSVPVHLYRTVRLLAFREVLGSRISSAILYTSGRSVAQSLGVRSLQDMLPVLEEFCIGKLAVESQTDSSATIVCNECATCSGLPDIGEPLCSFEAGLVSGVLEEQFGAPVRVTETQCWGLGDSVCRWSARSRARSDAEGACGPVDPLEVIMEIAGRAVSSVDASVAIRRKNRELREACRQLGESERLKRDLTDMVVHDMRTPLTAMMGSLETLCGTLTPKASRQEADLLRIATSSGLKLVRMIDDLLDISRLEERKAVLVRRPVRVVGVVEDATDQIALQARRKRVDLDFSIMPDSLTVLADEEYVVRVLVNLLDNAVRHTRAGGSVSVVAREAPDQAMATIQVADTGEGIPPEHHQAIFDKFVQVDARRSRRRASSGLGLTFCKLVTEAHGGSISVDSVPGGGSTFTVSLPVQR